MADSASPIWVGGDASYYELPRGPNGEFPKTLHEIIIWYNDGVGMHWSQANILKAAYRWDKKPSLEYNLDKMDWFCRDARHRLYDSINPKARKGERSDNG